MSKQQSVEQVLQNNQRLFKIIEHSHYLRGVNQTVLSVLPEPLVEHCQVANYDKGKLVLLVDNPVWLQAVQYARTDICQKLQKFTAFSQLSQVRAIVDYRRQLTQPATAHPALQRLSADTVDLLKASAAMIKHPSLANALKRLSRHHL